MKDYKNYRKYPASPDAVMLVAVILLLLVALSFAGREDYAWRARNQMQGEVFNINAQAAVDRAEADLKRGPR